MPTYKNKAEYLLNNQLRFTRSHPEFYEVDVHKKFAKFTRKHLYHTLFLASLQDGTLLLKRQWKNNLQNISKRLLLTIRKIKICIVICKSAEAGIQMCSVKKVFL